MSVLRTTPQRPDHAESGDHHAPLHGRHSSHLARRHSLRAWTRAIGLWCVMTMIMLHNVPLSVAVEPNVWSVERLVSVRDEWPKMVDLPLVVEGRVTTQLKHHVRLAKCELIFLLNDSQLTAWTDPPQVELTGRLSMHPDFKKLVFVVQSVRPTPTDLDRLRQRESELPPFASEKWFELADWAAERAEFFDDEELLAAAQSLRQRGVLLAAERLPAGDVDGQLALVDKARQFRLPDVVVDARQHAAFWNWSQRARKPAAAATDLTALVRRLEQTWPEAFHPLKAWPTELATRYRRTPQLVYEAANDDERRQLRRVFGIDVAAETVRRESQTAGLDLAATADRMLSAIPDAPQYAAEVREQYWKHAEQTVTQAARPTVEQVARHLKQYQQIDRAKRYQTSWLSHRGRQLSAIDAPGMIELANDYRTMVGDIAKTVELLSAALRVEPENLTALGFLDELGYRQQDGRWIPADQLIPAPTRPNPSLPAAPQELAKGLTASQLATLMGQPSVKTRVIGRSAVDEVWQFGERGQSLLIVVLRKTAATKESRVVDFYTQ
jgi:hypothetical protein